MTGQKSADINVSRLYNPAKVTDFERVPKITAKGMELIKSHYNSDLRLRTISVRLLEYHAEYANLLAEAMIPKCQGKDDEAKEKLEVITDRMGRHEIAIEMYYDHCLAINALKACIFNLVSNSYMDVEDKKKK